jgi:hypothetical protein
MMFWVPNIMYPKSRLRGNSKKVLANASKETPENW